MRGWDSSFLAFREHLAQALRRDLPGIEAQFRLVPPGRPKPNLEEIKQSKNPRKAGVLALLYPIEDKPHLVLMKRHEYPGVHSGQISFPGGQWEPHDADLFATALRETQEEIGVAHGYVKVIGGLSEIYIPPSNFLVQPVVGIANTRPEFVPEEKEVQRILEIPFREFLNPANLRVTNVKARGFTMRVPAYAVENEIIWGATAMMIAELTHLFDDSAFQ